mgnify:CR=1 FL=1
MLSEIINVDLHIHSVFSEYKDGDIVKKSTIENIEKLIQKLNENEIVLCAVTDHNRFDYNLYNQLNKKIKETEGTLKNNLPGVEFDVKLEPGKPTCHIVGIFDDNDEEKLKELQTRMYEIKEIKSKEEYYELEEFENVIKNIGLNVILIVHQRQGIDNTNGSNQSLSAAVSNPSEFIQTGYIDCLEYNKPRVEGIVKNSLRDIGISYPLITGSDCHDWEVYPYHDATVEKVERNFTHFKCLPTFKGLLMSITSFKTRANRIKNSNANYIKSFTINDAEYNLTNGINVIIGDNGSGKSLLASVLSDKIEPYYKKLISSNKISKIEVSKDIKIKTIKQGDIVKQVRDGNLFENKDYFENINTKDIFSTKIKSYFDNVLKYILFQIKKETEYNKLSNMNLTITPINKKLYWSVLESEIELENVSDDKNRYEFLSRILNQLENEIEEYKNYYSEKNLYDKMKSIYDDVKDVKNNIQQLYLGKTNKNKVRSIIKDRMNELKNIVESKSNSNDNQKRNILNEYRQFKESIVNCVRVQSAENSFPKFPEKINGTSKKEFKGYNFYKKAEYHDQYLKNEFYNFCFNEQYSNEESLKKINKSTELDSALKGATYEQIEDFKRLKINGFIEKYSKETTEISDIATSCGIGNTPGEISLIYYKFITEENDSDFDVLIIDQPEDDINPNRIKNHLNVYLNSIKDKKQVIIVTHNPLLVVNLDVDNVIYLNKINNRIEVKNGALEYENKEKDYSILDLVKENLDGGYDAIERRLKAYDRD